MVAQAANVQADNCGTNSARPIQDRVKHYTYMQLVTQQAACQALLDLALLLVLSSARKLG